MRKIKFRAWDKKSESFAPTMYWYIDPIGDIRWQVDDSIAELEVTQYTGLRDMNDKEIYEGDIIKINPDDDEWIDVIIRDKNWLELKTYNNKCVTNCSLYEHHNIVEVIGNIYENPKMQLESKYAKKSKLTISDLKIEGGQFMKARKTK